MGIQVPEQAKFVNANPRDFVVLVLESSAQECQEDAHDMVFLVDITDATRPFPASNYQVPELVGGFAIEVAGLVPTRRVGFTIARFIKVDRGILF